jgi:hypothetical protein
MSISKTQYTDEAITIKLELTTAEMLLTEKRFMNLMERFQEGEVFTETAIAKEVDSYPEISQRAKLYLVMKFIVGCIHLA